LKIRFTKEETKGKVLIEEYWDGLLLSKKTRVHYIELLDFEWIQKTFSEEFIVGVKDCAGKNGFVDVPPGAPRNVSKVPIAGYPIIIYRQDNHEGGKCLFLSLANAFASIENTMLTKQIAQRLAEYAFYHNDTAIHAWKDLKSFMSIHAKWFQQFRIGNSSYENLITQQSHYPKVLILQGTDGSTNHAIAIVGNMIFDFYEKSALPLSQTNFDWCVGASTVQSESEDPIVKFVCVVVGIHFCEHEKKKNPIIKIFK